MDGYYFDNKNAKCTIEFYTDSVKAYNKLINISKLKNYININLIKLVIADFKCYSENGSQLL